MTSVVITSRERARVERMGIARTGYPPDVTDSMLRTDGLAAPERSARGTEIGYRCDTGATDSDHVLHDGCPGWWPDLVAEHVDGWTCACECHEQGAGWPGYDEHLAFVN